MIPFDQAMEELRRSFDVAPGSLDRCEEILQVQHLSLAKNPPLARLPDAVRLAASARMRSGEPVMLRERVPVEIPRVVEVFRALARTLMDEPGALDALAREWVEVALPPATADDAPTVHALASRLALPPESAVSLLREAMKPEMLRTSTAFTSLAHDAAGARRRCPLCASLPAACTERDEACCSWCGLVFLWDPSACGACGKSSWRQREIAAVVRHARLLQCDACGDVAKVFRCSADPLLLSLHGVLIAPFELAARVTSDGTPSLRFSVF